MEYIKNVINNIRSHKRLVKFIVNFVVPAMLILGWVFFVFYRAYVIENVFTIVTDSYSHSSYVQLPKGELHQGQKIIGKFKANYDNLGIIGVRFWNFFRINKDHVIFRIKEENAPDWYYTNDYGSDQFPANGYFTFGFPLIEGTKGKTFVFEVESVSGTDGNAIGASEQTPAFIVKYQYSRARITASPQNFSSFALLKLHNLIKNSEFTSFVYIYLLPAVLYILYILGPGRTITKSFGWQFRYVIAWVRKIAYKNKIGLSHTLLITGILADTLFVKNSDLTLSILVVMTLAIWIAYKRSWDEMFLFALAALAISLLTYYADALFIGERAGSWTWVFLTIWSVSRLRKLDEKSESADWQS